tara:strand:- start:343 stop:516 length:174 start_codon:yes stop_codon:yes gene_type:complete
MKKLFIIIIILFNGCSSSFDKKEVKNNFIFSNEMTFEEFKLKLEEYVENNSYPNPDN